MHGIGVSSFIKFQNTKIGKTKRGEGCPEEH
jgi:hypothetical protein